MPELHTSGSRPLSLSECPVCSRLADVELSYAKGGWDEQSLPFPDAVGDLILLEEDAHDAEGASSGISLMRCPECGTLYRYTWSGEYLSNGSEERSELRRLAPAQAREQIDAAAYDWLMSWMGLWLSHTEPAVRRHAGRSLAAHHLAAQQTEMVRTLLMSSDSEVARGALLLLRDAIRDREWAVDLTLLKSAVALLEHSPEEEIARAAQYLSHRMQRGPA